MSGSLEAEPGRDNRHILLAERMGIDEHVARTKFSKSTVLITGQAERLLQADGRVMATTALNLIARFCPRIDVYMPQSIPLATELVSLGTTIDSSEAAEYRALHELDATTEYGAVLSIGTAPSLIQNATEIAASGWLAGVNSTGPAPALPGGGWCGPGALAAAALGASQVFIKLLDPPKEVAKLSPQLIFSTYDYSVLADPTDVPVDAGPVLANVDLSSVLLGGCGAVGQAFIYSLLRLPIKAGRVWAVDDDRIDLTNLNRCLLAFQGHVEMPQPPWKVDIVKEAAGGTALQIHADSRRISEALKNGDAYPFGYPTLVVCGVDNNDARKELQHIWPDLFLEGSTGDAQVQVLRWEYGHNHGCSLCYHGDDETTNEPYHERMSVLSGLSPDRVGESLGNANAEVTEADVLSAPPDKRSFLEAKKGRTICSVLSEVERFTHSEETPEEPSVSFTSFLAGVILASEAVKHSLSLPQQLESQFLADTLLPIDHREVVHLTPMPDCYCQKRKHTIDQLHQARHPVS